MSQRNVDRAGILALLEKKGATRADLARALGVSGSRITEILKGDRGVKDEELPIMADFLGVEINCLLRLLGINVPEKRYMLVVQGYVTGDEVIINPAPDESYGLDEVESPWPGYDGRVLRIRGTDMAPRYLDGELVAYRPDRSDIAGCLGRNAIIELEDGRLVLKTPHQGAEPDLYNLVSNNPAIPPLVNVRIRAAWRIDWHAP